jgi:hypothetical protein
MPFVPPRTWLIPNWRSDDWRVVCGSSLAPNKSRLKQCRNFLKKMLSDKCSVALMFFSQKEAFHMCITFDEKDEMFVSIKLTSSSTEILHSLNVQNEHVILTPHDYMLKLMSVSTNTSRMPLSMQVFYAAGRLDVSMGILGSWLIKDLNWVNFYRLKSSSD